MTHSLDTKIGMGIVLLQNKCLWHNLSPIFRWFSINLPQPKRSYAACSDFRRKKLKIFCDINL